uniref:Plexin cytoplasmic RasGAP domain-containing protein n=1 Tax=Petromyzon marinus TaxID=7757 RepID=S4RNR0_PETMA
RLFVSHENQNSDLSWTSIPWCAVLTVSSRVFGGCVSLCCAWRFPQVPELRRQMMEEGIGIFSTLLNNQKFLITFIHTLEQQKDFTVKDRCYLASWLTAALQGNLEYYTAVLKELLVDLIRSSTNKHPKLMLRRTESVVEKMLTNWMSICMYGFLRDRVGEPFFLLLTAIRQQISKGPVDAVTGRAKYTLSEDWLLRENIEATAL